MALAHDMTATGWRTILAARGIAQRLEEGHSVDLTADEIKRLSKREPRLMTKFDARERRPRPLKNVTILPVNNGLYRLLPGDGYHDVEPPTRLHYWPVDEASRRTLTLPWTSTPSSEMQALDMATCSGLLPSFLEEERLFMTIRGRRRSPRFTFRFRGEQRDHELTVEGVQVEVDAGMEGESIHLVEAKMGAYDNFHVRQLYYPVRMWSELVPHKRVVPSFLSYTNRVFSLRRYDFDALDVYQSLRLVAAADYVLDREEASPSLAQVLSDTQAQPPPGKVPFPQADDVNRVADLVDTTVGGITTNEGLARRFGFTERQSGYYGNAAALFGLVDRYRGGFRPTLFGTAFAAASRGRRNRLLLEGFARSPVLRLGLEHLVASGAMPPREAVASWLEEHTELTGTTVGRRAQTVLRWLEWARGVTAP